MDYQMTGTEIAYVQTDADAVQAAAEREASFARMLREADLDAHVERMAEQEFSGEGEDEDFDPTPVLAIDHPGMSAKWFDFAVHRAHMAGCRVLATGRPGFVYVTSGSSVVMYHVTRHACSCEGHRRGGKCLHRSLAIFEVDVMGINRRHATPLSAA